MKKSYAIMLFIYSVQHINAQKANQNLSNLLSPTAVNVHLLPKTDDSLDLGSTSQSWKDLYLGGSIYVGGLRFASGVGLGHNTAIGLGALNPKTYGAYNTAIGFNALFSNTYGEWNIANGYCALYSNTTGYANTAIGDSALYSNTEGDYNTANGNGSLYSNKAGYDNTANGNYSLYSNTGGNENTADGGYALFDNTKGNDNTADGGYALGENTTGNENTASGEESLENNTSGSYNVGDGRKALASNTTGNYNTAVGSNALIASGSLSNLVAVGNNALYNLDGGSGHCTAVGSEAGYNNITGSNNTYLGYHAGNTVTYGSSNTIIGYGADVSNGSFSNATAIGNLAVANASNKVRIGNSSVTSIGGQVSWTTGSDERIKINVQQNVPGLKFINLLKPVTYSYDVDKEDAINGIADKEKPAEKYEIQKIQFTGFLAQEVEKAAQQIGYDFSGVDVPKTDKDIYGLRYSDFVVPLVKAVQELSAKNDELKKQIDELKSMMKQMQQCSPCNQLSTQNSQSSETKVNNAALEQNTPNPFNHTTTIGYILPGKFSSAQIIITDKTGNQLKQFNISNTGKGTITVDASTLASGAYYYSLYVDGKLITSKQMILTK